MAIADDEYSNHHFLALCELLQTEGTGGGGVHSVLGWN
jgi:hypothetical protein